MTYLIVSAATEGSRYVDCLQEQRQMFGARYLGLVVPDRGDWASNTKIKPDAIREGFNHARMVMWVDADCLFAPPDEPPPGNYDIWTAKNICTDHRNRISAAFIMFRNNVRTKAFLRHWERANNRHSKDHPALTRTIQQLRNRVSIGDMTDWLGYHEINTLAPERYTCMSE